MVRRRNCLNLAAIAIIIFTQYGCATLLTGKYQQIPVVQVDSSICVTAFLPKPIDKSTNNSLSDDMGSLPINKSEYYRISQTTQNGYIVLPRPTPKQSIHIGFQPCRDTTNVTMAQCPSAYQSMFNEPALLNFVLPWNWMIDAYTGALFRWKINKPLSQ